MVILVQPVLRRQAAAQSLGLVAALGDQKVIQRLLQCLQEISRFSWENHQFQWENHRKNMGKP